MSAPPQALTLIEFLIKNGSERIIEAARDKLYKIRTLQEFNFYEGTQDKGSGVREMAKKVVELLNSNDQIRVEREKARNLRNKFVGISNDGRSRGGGAGDSYYSGSGDSYRGGGGGGGGSYNGSGGGGNSYSGGGGGGGSSYDRDSYSGGGGGGGGGRYDGEPYGASKSSAPSGPKGYGGGAYDSSRPPRFGDDVPDEPPAKDKTTKDDEEEDEDDFRASKAGKGKASSGGAGKLKVNIKKTASATTSIPASGKSAAKEIDLFGGSDDFMSGPAVPAAAPSSVFDPFAAPAASHSAFPSQGFDQQSFAAFPSSTPAFQSAAPAFDPFAAPMQQAPQAPAAAFPGMSAGFPTQPAPQQQQLFQQQQFAPVQQQGGWGFQQAAPVPAPAPQVPSFSAAGEPDFGDFETANQSQGQSNQGQSNQFTSPPQAPAANKWGDIDKLVNLGGITKNEDEKAKSAAAAQQMNYSHQSFAGLDGFSKPHNMVRFIRTFSLLGTQSMANIFLSSSLIRWVRCPCSPWVCLEYSLLRCQCARRSPWAWA